MPNDTCAAHSGLIAKINILLWLSGIATAMLLALFPVAMKIQTDITTNTYAIDINRMALDKEAEKNRGQHLREQARLRDLEKFSHKHTGGL